MLDTEMVPLSTALDIVVSTLGDVLFIHDEHLWYYCSRERYGYAKSWFYRLIIRLHVVFSSNCLPKGNIERLQLALAPTANGFSGGRTNQVTIISISGILCNGLASSVMIHAEL